MVQIKTTHAKELKIVYSITGPGADQPPVNLFTIDRETGQLYVTQPLDREKQAFYLLFAHAISVDGTTAEDPIEIKITVIDQNDNRPYFTRDPYLGRVSEASKVGFEFMEVAAADADEPGNPNSDLRYRILSQDPPLPLRDMFDINPFTGKIRVKNPGLDKEKIAKYILEIQAADNEGHGLVATCSAIITLLDSNDNAPQFEKYSYTASVSENVVGASVVTMLAADDDEPNTPAWTMSFKIVSGDDQEMFNVSTEPNKQSAVIRTVKPLDFEKQRKHLLVVAVENDIPFAVSLPTSTALVTVRVKDENEAPVFSPGEKIISKPEDLPAGTALVTYSATDPDTERKQTVKYKIGSDPGGWLLIDSQTGRITVRSSMDRESDFVHDGKYSALILAVDDDDIPATGTGTLVIVLQDVNDHPPTIKKTSIAVCNQDPESVVLPVLDGDGPGLSDPFSVELMDPNQDYWTIEMNATGTGIVFKFKPTLLQRDFNIVLRVCDSGGLCKNNTIFAHVNEGNCVTKGSFCIIEP